MKTHFKAFRLKFDTHGGWRGLNSAPSHHEKIPNNRYEG